MTDIIQTRYRSSAIVQDRNSSTSSPPTRQHLSQPQHHHQPATALPSASAMTHTTTTPSSLSHRTSASSLQPSAAGHAKYCNGANSALPPYSPASPPQQSRPDPAALRPSPGLGPGTSPTRLRSGSNPFLNRDSLLGPSSASLAFNAGVSAPDSLLDAQRRAYRESRENNSSGSSSSGIATLAATNSGSRSYLNEPSSSTTTTTTTTITTTTTSNSRSRATPSPNPGVNRSSGGTGGTGGTSYSTAGGTRTRAVTSADTRLADRPSYGTPMARDRSSTGIFNSVNTPAKSPSPLPPRTHSHSVSVPSVNSTRVSTQSPVQPFTVASPPPPPLTRYSTKPSTTSANSSISTNSSAASTAASSVQSSQGATPGTSPLGPVSAVDVVGKRLRERQLHDRFKAAQDFIERTVGKPLPSSDLHESLKDGVILCRLANRLRPGTVEQISLKNLPFVKMENISNFLNAARQLGVQSSDLFQTVDLYEGKDMTQVVSTILTLERVVGGVARMIVKDNRPGPNPIVSEGSTPADILKVGGKAGAPVLSRVRSKTAHTPSAAGTTASIRPSISSYYAAQVRKLEEESIRFANGYDILESNLLKTRDRRQSTPTPRRGTPPSVREKVSRHPSLNDIVAGVEDMRFGSDDLNQNELDAETRREQRDLVFGRTTPSPFNPPISLPKSASGPLLTAEGRSSALDMARRKKKSISLDPQAANAVMGVTGFREGYGSPGSPGILAQSASYNAISTLTGPGQVISLSFAKHHSRTSSEKTLDGNHLSTVGTPTTSRSTTPVQGLRKSTNSVEPLREKLELWESDLLVATFQLGNCIGRGQFGSVYKALNLVTGQMVAVKRIKIDGLKDTEMDILMQEVDLLKSLTHPSIVKYEGFIRSSGYLNIILEFVENGSLLTTLKSFGTFPEKLVVAYVVKILEGLVYLHGKEVVHCDLKAANILTTKNGNVKLSDFGVSLNLKVKESDFGAVAGTPNWMAPEVIELKGASPASDIWSLGCTVIEMLTGQPPYAELLPLTTLFRIVEDERPPLPSNLSMDLLDFLCQCFQKDPSLRPSAGALGRHIWIKRNFTSRELKPMDSLPYMKRKSMEPKEKLLIVAALEGGSSAKRASTPLGLSSGAPPPAASATAMNGSGRSFRRGSVDSASGYYSSSTVPAPTSLADRHPEFQKGGKAPSQHTFVKSSFAKPVECRLCHDYVKKQAVICQDCSMVFHRKCQFYVGDTCFPGPHLSYFQSPSPAQSVPNLKLLSNGKPPGSSRPNSRTSQITLEDRSRSVTPSQAAPTPPPGFFSKRDSAAERVDQRRMISSPPPPPLSPGSAYRAKSPDGYPQSIDSGMQGQGQNSSQVPRPSSRQSDNSPTSPTLSGLRNLISRPRRFSFGKKGSVTPTAVPGVQLSSADHPLPTPPTSYTSSPSNMALNGGARSQAGTPDSNKSCLFNGFSDNSQQRQRAQPPVTPPNTLPVPIAMAGGKSGSAGRAYRGREYLPGGPFDPMDEEVHNGMNNFGRVHQRPSSITLFSTSAPPVRSEYQVNSGNRSGRSSAASSKYSRDGCDTDDDDNDDEADQDDQGEIGEMNEEDLEALLIPSVVRTPRSSIDAGKPVAGAGYNRVRNPSISQTLSQQQQDTSRPPSAISFSPSSFTGRATTPQQLQHQQQQQPLHYHPGRSQFNNGYSSGSSSVAMTSSYSSHSNNSSSASSLGSVAALIEEEERQLKEFQLSQRHFSSSNGQHQQHQRSSNNYNNKMLDVPSGYHLGGTQSSQSHHVGIRTMLGRFSNSNRDTTPNTTITNNNNHNSNNSDGLLGSSYQEKRESLQHLPVPTANKSPSAYAASSRYPIHALNESQQQQNQQPQHHVPVGDHFRSTYGGGIPRKSSDSKMSSTAGGLGGGIGGYLNDHQDRNNMVNTSNSNSSNTHQYPIGRHRSGSVVVGGVDESLRSSAATSSAAAAAAAAAAASALKHGGKVIRRSMGATLENDRWD